MRVRCVVCCCCGLRAVGIASTCLQVIAVRSMVSFCCRVGASRGMGESGGCSRRWRQRGAMQLRGGKGQRVAFSAPWLAPSHGAWSWSWSVTVLVRGIGAHTRPASHCCHAAIQACRRRAIEATGCASLALTGSQPAWSLACFGRPASSPQKSSGRRRCCGRESLLGTLMRPCDHATALSQCSTTAYAF